MALAPPRDRGSLDALDLLLDPPPPRRRPRLTVEKLMIGFFGVLTAFGAWQVLGFVLS